MTVVPQPPHFWMFLRLKLKVKGRPFDTTEVVESESQAVLNTRTQYDFKDALRKNCWSAGNNAYGRKGATSRVIVVRTPKVSVCMDGSARSGNDGRVCYCRANALTENDLFHAGGAQFALRVASLDFTPMPDCLLSDVIIQWNFPKDFCGMKCDAVCSGTLRRKVVHRISKQQREGILRNAGNHKPGRDIVQGISYLLNHQHKNIKPHDLFEARTNIH
jgi:hypothetical protein